MSEGDYVDLSLNPERFTGYTGPSAHRVWNSIYEENCFGISKFDTLGALSGSSDSSGLMKTPVDPSESECLEERVYYKIISGERVDTNVVCRKLTFCTGLHASISTHICNEDFNQSTHEWGPNLQCFIDRIASYPERLQYIYFNTVLLLRAVARIGPYLSAYDYCGDDMHENDAYTLEKLTNVIQTAQNVGKFDETVLFRGENANVSSLRTVLLSILTVSIGFERRVQTALPQCHKDHGLRRMRQVPVMGQSPDVWCGYGIEDLV
jgi:ERO1-like protein beta